MLINQVIPWLLSAATPTIRNKTYLYLLNLPESDPKVASSRDDIALHGPVPEILSLQITPGQWPYVNHYYTPKYVSTHWSFMLLEELAVNPDEERFQSGVEYMLAATHEEIRKRQSPLNTGWTCLWGNIIRYVFYAGRYKDERFQEMLQLTASSLYKANCNCVYNQNYDCAWGVARSLWGLAAIPESNRSDLVKNAINQGVDFLLRKFSLVTANYPVPDDGKIHSVWSRINFPLFYQADILFVLRVLCELNHLDHPGAQPALDWLQKRRKTDGTWHGSSPFRQRTWKALGNAEETHRWVTLQALDILTRAGRMNIVDI